MPQGFGSQSYIFEQGLGLGKTQTACGRAHWDGLARQDWLHEALRACSSARRALAQPALPGPDQAAC